MILTGARGEHAAENYLIRQGYRIIDRNYRCRFGEIDIIASKDGYLAFVEVKTRARGSLVGGVYSVDARKQRRLTATAETYLSHVSTPLQPRFDVVIVEADDGAYKITNHIENAF